MNSFELTPLQQERFDALPEEVPALKALVKDVMENVIKLSVPLTVECSAGANWLEAH